MLLINTVGTVNRRKKFPSNRIIDQLTKKSSFLAKMHRETKNKRGNGESINHFKTEIASWLSCTGY
jgi:hypothetical protein